MNQSNKETVLVSLSAILWLAIAGLAWTGHWYPALFVLLALISIYAALGTTRGGRIDLKLFLFPALTWLALWAVTFALAQHHALEFAGRKPDFSVLGFHPSFAWILLVYWLGGALVMTLGYYFMRNAWLSDERWDEFVDSVKRINAAEEGSP